jgi:hypothetical protein
MVAFFLWAVCVAGVAVALPNIAGWPLWLAVAVSLGAGIILAKLLVAGLPKLWDWLTDCVAD